jgi:perosamine synthetase
LRDRVRDSLRDKGIGSQIYFTPIHHQPFYQKCQSENIPHLPYTDQAAKECLAIPFHSKLSDAEIRYVCDAIQQALEPPNQEPATVREAAQFVSTQVMET